MQGALQLKPLQAELFHSTEHNITKMDPYCLFTLGNQKVKTSVCKGAGGKPFWSDMVTLNMSSGDNLLFIELWDANKKDRYIANCQVSVANYQELDGACPWIDLFYDGRPAGKLLLNIACQTGENIGASGITTGVQQTDPYLGKDMNKNLAATNFVQEEIDPKIGNKDKDIVLVQDTSNIPIQETETVFRGASFTGASGTGYPTNLNQASIVTGGVTTVPVQSGGLIYIENVPIKHGTSRATDVQYDTSGTGVGSNYIPYPQNETNVGTTGLFGNKSGGSSQDTTGLMGTTGTSGTQARNVGTGAVIPPSLETATFNKEKNI